MRAKIPAESDWDLGDFSPHQIQTVTFCKVVVIGRTGQNIPLVGLQLYTAVERATRGCNCSPALDHQHLTVQELKIMTGQTWLIKGGNFLLLRCNQICYAEFQFAQKMADPHWFHPISKAISKHGSSKFGEDASVAEAEYPKFSFFFFSRIHRSTKQRKIHESGSGTHISGR